MARWYDPLTGHFTQADTIIPEPGKASAWDRYSYVQNNPLRYSDPSGYFPFDEILDVIFLVVDLSLIYIEGPTPINEAAFSADVLCAVIPYATGGGLAVRVGGEVALEGATHIPGAIRIAQGSEKYFQFSQNSNESDSSQNSKTYSSLEDAKREINKRSVDENLKNSDTKHLEAVLKEQKGEEVVPGKKFYHEKDVASARKGLENALERIKGALKSPAWSHEARQFFTQQQNIIEERIKK